MRRIHSYIITLALRLSVEFVDDVIMMRTLEHSGAHSWPWRGSRMKLHKEYGDLHGGTLWRVLFGLEFVLEILYYFVF